MILLANSPVALLLSKLVDGIPFLMCYMLNRMSAHADSFHFQTYSLHPLPLLVCLS